MDKGCSSLLTWLHKHTMKSRPNCKINHLHKELIVLAIGLALRDLVQVVAREDETENVRPQIQKSILGKDELETLVKMCKMIHANALYVL
jgi:hypothetical protein